MLQANLKKDYNYSYIDNRENNKDVRNNKISTLGVIVWFVIAIIIGGIIVSYISQFVQIAHLNYRINSLEENLDILKEENKLMNLKLAKELSMARIENIARNELNMVEPEKVEIVFLDKTEKIDILPQEDRNQVFFVRIFNNFIERFGTVKAEELR